MRARQLNECEEGDSDLKYPTELCPMCAAVAWNPGIEQDGRVYWWCGTPATCPDCKGTGRMKYDGETEEECDVCRGTGKSFCDHEHTPIAQ